MTTITTPVFVMDHVECPYADVCATLVAWQGDHLWTGSAREAGIVGKLDHVSNWLARVPIVSRSTQGEPIAELRIIPVTTGNDPITELLVVIGSRGSGRLPTERDVRRARAILDAVVRRLASGRSHRRAS